MSNIVIYILCFLAFFLIHYLEGLPPIGAFSFAQLWKIPLLLYLLLYNILNIRKKERFEKAGYLLSAEYAFCPEILINPLNTLIRISKQLPFILFFGYWIHKYRLEKRKLEMFLYGMAQFISLSAVPFLLDIIQPLKSFHSADAFGIEGLIYFSGVFGAPHAAASYFCVSILVLVNGFILNKFESRLLKFYNAFLILIGLISIFKVYVRTGWLMLIIGLLCMFDWSKITLRKLCIILCAGMIFVGGILYLYKYNEAFYARITGRNIFNHAHATGFEMSGSGRTIFWHNAVINLWEADNLYYSLFGRGYTNVVKDNWRTTRLKVVSHNQFLDSLAQNGILGFIFLISFFLSLFHSIKARKGEYQRLCYGIYFSSLVFAFFQSEMYFDFAIILSLVTAILYINSEITDAS